MKKITPRWLAENEFICMGKLHEPIWQVQFLVFENFFVLIYTKLQSKSCYYLLIIYMKNAS